MLTKSGIYWVKWANAHAKNSNKISDLEVSFQNNVKGTSINSGRDRLRSQIHRIKAQIAGNSLFIAQICNAEAVDLGFKMFAHELIEVPLKPLQKL